MGYEAVLSEVEFGEIEEEITKGRGWDFIEDGWE